MKAHMHVVMIITSPMGLISALFYIHPTPHPV